jgi:hypothetical protein
VAPDFARTVDIHRKPGYDPVELFLDPKQPWPKLKIAWRLLQKKMGLRMLMDVVPLEAELVKGSHGIQPSSAKDYPFVSAPSVALAAGAIVEATEIYRFIKEQVLA